MRGDIEVGARLPDYELPDQDGVVRRLSEPAGLEPDGAPPLTRRV